jgi:hypothetical protein
MQFPTAEIDTDGVLILNLKEMVAASHMPRKERTVKGRGLRPKGK